MGMSQPASTSQPEHERASAPAIFYGDETLNGYERMCAPASQPASQPASYSMGGERKRWQRLRRQEEIFCHFFCSGGIENVLSFCPSGFRPIWPVNQATRGGAPEEDGWQVASRRKEVSRAEQMLKEGDLWRREVREVGAHSDQGHFDGSPRVLFRQRKGQLSSSLPILLPRRTLLAHVRRRRRRRGVMVIGPADPISGLGSHYGPTAFTDRHGGGRVRKTCVHLSFSRQMEAALITSSPSFETINGRRSSTISYEPLLASDCGGGGGEGQFSPASIVCGAIS